MVQLTQSLTSWFSAKILDFLELSVVSCQEIQFFWTSWQDCEKSWFSWQEEQEVSCTSFVVSVTFPSFH